MGAQRKGIKLTYCTDTRPTQSIVDHADHSDLFICEGMYGEKDKEAKAREYKHMTFYEAARLAKTAQVKEMWLTHYSPSLTRPEEYMDEVRKIFPAAKAGKDKKPWNWILKRRSRAWKRKRMFIFLPSKAPVTRPPLQLLRMDGKCCPILFLLRLPCITRMERCAGDCITEAY